jgi:hypothetical protein
MFGWLNRPKALSSEAIASIVEDVHLIEHALMVQQPLGRISVADRLMRDIASSLAHPDSASSRRFIPFHQRLLEETTKRRQSFVFASLQHETEGKGSSFGQPDWASATLFETWLMSRLQVLGSMSDEVGRHIFNWAQQTLGPDECQQIARKAGLK